MTKKKIDKVKAKYAEAIADAKAKEDDVLEFKEVELAQFVEE